MAFHEYFHAVQTAHVFTKDHGQQESLMGPMWWIEGGAEYMARVTSRHLSDVGTLTASTWTPLADQMTWDMNNDVKPWIAANEGASASTIPYGPNQHIGYSYGTWAHAWLADRFGPDLLLDSFYPNLNDLGWEGSFVNTYGMSSTDFLADFDAFADLPISEQLLILD